MTTCETIGGKLVNKENIKEENKTTTKENEVKTSNL
jgi:hypothetical protein